MSFLHPGIFVAGLVAVALPVLIHLLFRRRRKPVPWAAMRFLLEAYKAQRRRLQLEQWLLLLLRCAVVALLGAALARPLLGQGLGAPAAIDLMIVLDDSIASGVRGGDGERDLTRSARAADQALAALDESRGDRASVVTLAGPATLQAGGEALDLAAVRRVIMDTEAKASSADWAGGADIVRAWLAGGDRGRARRLLVLSGLRQGSVPADTALERLLPDAGDAPRVLALAPSTGPAMSVAVAGVEPTRAVAVEADLEGPAGQVRVLLRRSGDAAAFDDAVTRLRLVAVDADAAGTDAEASATIADASVRWQAGETERAVMLSPRYPADRRGERLVFRAVVETPGDALDLDNGRHSGMRVRPRLRVALIARESLGEAAAGELDPAGWMTVALRPTPGDRAPIEVVRVDPADVSAARMGRVDAAVVLEPGSLRDPGWAELADLLERGGAVLLVPEVDAAAARWGDRLAGLGVPIRVGLEPRTHEPAAGVVAAASADELGPLSLLAGELVDLAAPVRVFRSLPLTLEAGAGAVTPLRLASDGPLVAVARAARGGEAEPRRVGRAEGGTVLVLGVAMSLEWSDLPARPLFLPMVQELIRQSVGPAAGEAQSVWTAGSVVQAGGSAVELLGLADEPRFALSASGATTTAVNRAGAWVARDASGQDTGVVLVTPDLRGAVVGPRSREDAGAWLGPWAGEAGVAWVDEPGAASGDGSVAAALAQRDGGTPMDWPLLVLAGLLAVLEVALARFASHAEREPAAGVSGVVASGGAAA